jgi:hypothetical protein
MRSQLLLYEEHRRPTAARNPLAPLTLENRRQSGLFWPAKYVVMLIVRGCTKGQPADGRDNIFQKAAKQLRGKST